MPLTLAWVLEALRYSYPKVGAVFFPPTSKQKELRAALREFVDPVVTVAMGPLDNRVAGLEKSVKRFEQFHCEHEFKNVSEGCLESIFCSVCGALHPDWERTYPHVFGYADGDEPVRLVIVDDKHFCTKARKPATKKRK